MEGKQVLIADDETLASNTIQMLLNAQKVASQVYTDGISLVEGYKAQYNNILFILVDISMPKMDGCQATKEIRAFEKSKGITPIKIYGLSGDNDGKTQDACKAAGMTQLLQKPLKKAQLQTLL